MQVRKGKTTGTYLRDLLSSFEDPRRLNIRLKPQREEVALLLSYMALAMVRTGPFDDG